MSRLPMIIVSSLLVLALTPDVLARARGRRDAAFLAQRGLAQVFQSARQQRLPYPETPKVLQTDHYFGSPVTDPYRWLEDQTSPATVRWVEAQNQLTSAYLTDIPYRQALMNRLQALYSYPRYSAPVRRGDHYFFFKNDGLQNQNVLYRQHGLGGEPEVLLDPNQFSEDGTTRLINFVLSKEGRYAAYGISEGGSDWETYHVMDVATGERLPDELQWVKVSNIAWQGNGFYYSRYDAPEPGTELSSRNEFHKVYYHQVGSPQSADRLVYEDRQNPHRFHVLETTEDERFLILYVNERGSGKEGNALYFRDLSQPESAFTPIVDTIGEDHYGVIDNVGDRLLLWTNQGAPNGRVILYDPQQPAAEDWRTLLPEGPKPLESITLAGGKLFVTYLEDVATRSYVFSLDGELENEIELPTLGTAVGFDGNNDDPFVFYTFTSFTYPSTIYRYDIAARQSSVFRIPGLHFDLDDYETRQIFYQSKDGTRIPMFIIHRKGLELNGDNPTLLTAYGGFGSSVQPWFSPFRIALLEQGFVFALANIRGGGEYGRTWHEAARRLNRQNAFDDFIAAAEYLIDQHYTDPNHLSITGASNGGLLMGVVMNQRPDLFKVVVPQTGVMDMLRFHQFTIGWNWIPEYGSSDNEADFHNLYRYSPLHNIREGVHYPATLITTADRDDRVVPAHSYKYAATLQSRQAGRNPILIRIDTNSGHGASNTSKQIAEAADIYSFIFHNLGVEPEF